MEILTGEAGSRRGLPGAVQTVLNMYKKVMQLTDDSFSRTLEVWHSAIHIIAGS